MTVTEKDLAERAENILYASRCHLADVTGFVEERMNGQSVVKVFNHERKSEEEFDKLNEELFESASAGKQFRKYDGTGDRQYRKPAVCSDSGSRTACFLLPELAESRLGVMASYLQFTKSFTQPFMQVAQQFNSIVMALAGAERIFQSDR